MTDTQLVYQHGWDSLPMVEVGFSLQPMKPKKDYIYIEIGWGVFS